jgi:parallel beta-helix repeat protein
VVIYTQGLVTTADVLLKVIRFSSGRRLHEPYNSIAEEASYEVIGLAIDTSTGYVYATTKGDDFRVYDSSLALKDTETQDISGPAGVAVGGQYKPDVFYLDKDDDVVDCVSPEDYISYTITYGADGNPDTGVVITDRYPEEVTFVSASTPYSHDPDNRTVTWNIGSVSGYGQYIKELQVEVNYYAKPGGTITNVVEMEGYNYYTKITKDTSVCCYGGDIIYVDKDATGGYNNGTSWDDAYTDLHDALGQAGLCTNATAIWVAAGTYKPTDDAEDTSASFELVDGVDVYGHFGGIGTYETSTSERDFGNSANTTTLDGQIGENYYEAVKYVLKGENIQEGILDGFTLRGSYGTGSAGIFLDSSDGAIVNCKLKDNGVYGIYATGCWPDIYNCTFDGSDTTGTGLYISYSVAIVEDCSFEDHSGYGIHASSSDLTVDSSVMTNSGYCGIYAEEGCSLTLEGSKIRYSGYPGVYLVNNLSTSIKNNWIHNNGIKHSTQYRSAGIYFLNQVSVPVVRNNTICDNYTYGIEVSQQGADPQIVSCIIWGNGTDDLYREGGTFNKVSYCCLQSLHIGSGNMVGRDPSFVNPAADDYHVTYDSPCVNAGKPNSTDPAETDIDGEPRVISEIVDIGADETECLPDCHPDYDEWGFVGKPSCWFWAYQCDGDADGTTETIFKYRIYGKDLAAVVDNWKKKIDDPTLDPCADIDHAAETIFKYRVYGKDLAAVVNNWKKKDADLPGDCAECQRWQEGRTTGGQLSVEVLIKWLEEVWLDPEVREVIDEDKWLKFVESVIEELARELHKP